jgi:hypothetical protein
VHPGLRARFQDSLKHKLRSPLPQMQMAVTPDYRRGILLLKLCPGKRMSSVTDWMLINFARIRETVSTDTQERA